MSIFRAMLFAFCVLTATFAVCQQEPMPDKLSPEMIKHLREQEQRMKDEVENSKRHPEPKFGFINCRADAQKWTSDPFDDKDARNLSPTKQSGSTDSFDQISKP